MSTEVTLSVPDDTYRRAEQIAGITDGSVPDVLTRALSRTLRPHTVTSPASLPVELMSDADVEALANSQMDARDNQRLSDLLDKQQRETLRDQERPDLEALFQVYQLGLLRKAQALRESVLRGLREPLEP